MSTPDTRHEDAKNDARLDKWEADHPEYLDALPPARCERCGGDAFGRTSDLFDVTGAVGTWTCTQCGWEQGETAVGGD